MPREPFGRGLHALVLDDEQGLCDVLCRILQSCAFTCDSAHDLADARAKVTGQKFDLFLLDQALPDGSGMDFIRDTLGAERDCALVMITGNESLMTAVEAMRLGVADYIVKPFEPNEVVTRVERVVKALLLHRENARLQREIAEKNARNVALEEMVARDPVTGLFNHAAIHEALEREIQRARRGVTPCSIILFDIDQFKGTNDTHGHLAGDSVLRALGDTFQRDSRAKSAPPSRGADVVGRYGGDEFLLVLPDTPKRGAAARAERLRAQVEGLKLPGVPAFTVSLGVAGFPEDAEDRLTLVRAADRALYAAKRAGRNRVMTYVPTLEDIGDAVPKGATEDLTRLIANKAFTYHYQPIVRAKDHAIVAYEGLVRPTDPAFRNPLELISAAERTGRITELGEVLRKAVVAPADRLEKDQMLFVNLHPYEMGDTLVMWAKSLPPEIAKKIVLEVTESVGLSAADYKRTSTLFAELRALGIRVAIDDLGAGYASLVSLTRLAPDFVKLDMNMIRGIKEDSRSARLIRHIAEYAMEEKIDIIGEGIETVEERDVTTRVGCGLLQGYYFAKPALPFVAVTVRPPS